VVREILYNNTSLPLYRKAMDAQADRHRAIASNIANAETPGYVSKQVHFEEQLKLALGLANKKLTTSDDSHIPTAGNPKNVQHVVLRQHVNPNTTGVNNVDVDREMVEMATNQIHYAMTVKRAAGLFSRIRTLTRMP
jgi:flagellar basal-body rod protein FlgB